MRLNKKALPSIKPRLSEWDLPAQEHAYVGKLGAKPGKAKRSGIMLITH